MKPLLAVRTPAEFRSQFFLWAAISILAFYAIHIFWRIRGFTGEQAILPILHLLTGTGLALMVSLRDPLRDTLAFADFAQSLAIACVVLAAATAFDITRLFSRLSFVPLLGALRFLWR